MKRVHTLVEGQTEEAFVATLLQPHFHERGLHLEPILITTRRVAAGPNYKGGIASWGKIKTNLDILLTDTSVEAVTTLIDYYALPNDTPGMDTRPAGSASQRVLHVEDRINACFPSGRVHAYLSLHEYEALLYADPGACGNYLDNPALTAVMTTAVSVCGGPELINDNPASTPCQRILKTHPSYRKTSDGPTIAQRIGLPQIRAVCSHFDRWIAWLEQLTAG